VTSDLQIGQLRVSGIDVEVAGEVGDLYFEQCAEQGTIFEPAVRVADLLLGDSPVLFDIGASIGAVTAALAQRFPTGHVVAFEAAPSVHRSLRETIRRSTGATVSLQESGVGAQLGTMRFHEDGNGSGWGFLSEELGGIDVPVTTVDETVNSLELDHVDFIKIDVEGGELGVLQGATNTLERHRPLLVFEVNVFCLWRYGRTLPQDLFAWVRERYPYTAVIDSNAEITHIEGDATVNHVLNLLGAGGSVIDVVASHEPIDVTTDDLQSAL
jgi:FkbM family methyltransferase